MHGGTAALASLLTVLWALAFVVQTWGLGEAGPLWLALGRAGFAVVPFLALPFVLRAVIAGSREMHRLALALGITNVAAFLPLQLAGLDRVGAGVGATIIYTQPVLVLLGAYWAFGEPLSRRRVIGSVSAFAGVIVIGIREAALGSVIGVLFLLGAALVWTAGSLFLKEASRRDVLPLLALQNLYGFLLLVPFVVAFEDPPPLSSTYVLTILYNGLIASALGWLILAVLMRRHEVGVVSSFIFVVPALAAALGIVFLDEDFTWPFFAGLVLVIVGIRLVVTTDRSRSYDIGHLCGENESHRTNRKGEPGMSNDQWSGLFEGKTAVVTGGISGIGEACSRVLLELGARVVGVDVDSERGNAVADELGPAFSFRSLDITDEPAVQALAAELEGDGNDVAALVNAAGVFVPNARAHEIPSEDYRRTFEVNLLGTAIMCRELFPLLRASGSGAIANIASQAALVSLPEQAAYTASKGAVAALTRSLAIDWARDAVRVNAICPGFTITPMSAAMTPQLIAVVERRVPLGRLFEAHEMANVLVFLVSPLASAMTGVVLPVDGGWTAGEAELPDW